MSCNLNGSDLLQVLMPDVPNQSLMLTVNRFYNYTHTYLTTVSNVVLLTETNHTINVILAGSVILTAVYSAIIHVYAKKITSQSKE